MSRSTGRIRLAIQFMSRRENWFISSSPITLAPLRSFLSADAVHHAADWTPALLLAAQSDRGLVGLRLPDPVPTPGRSRPSAGWLFAVTVLPFSSVVFPDCRARLGQGKSSSRGPLFRFIAAACVVLLARETSSEPKTDADCDQFRRIVESGRAVLSTNANLCGLSRTKVASLKREARIHDKHHFEFIFEFGKSDRTRVETSSVND